MLNSQFVHLHLHSEYSLLDGANRIQAIPKQIKRLGMDACAITDHGVMYGALEFYLACQKEGIKPIIGCEIYVSPENSALTTKKQLFQLVLLAADNQGLRNLNELVSLGFKHQVHGKPSVNHELLAQHKEGLIALSACLGGEIPQAILKGNMKQAEELAKWYDETFGRDNFYLEIEKNGLNDQQLVNSQLIRISNKLGIPLVATNDCHYMEKEDAAVQEILLCLQTGRRLSDENRLRLAGDELYIKSSETMVADFQEWPEAIENTLKIANRCNVTFEFGQLHLPSFDVPEDFANAATYLEHLASTGLDNYIHKQNISTTEIISNYHKRLEYELDVIIKMGFTDYFLIVWDFIAYAHRQKIIVGPGRGSGASSLVAFSLGITNIDPLQYDLIFERFLNVERVSMPDFDIDFCYERRQEVIDYVYQKYGDDRVCQVITFGTMAPRAVVRDVARVLDYPYADTDKLAKMIPGILNITLSKSMEQNPEFAKVYAENPDVKRIIDIALKLEGMPRHASTHAGGVIICGEKLTNFAPLAKNDEATVVQYTKNYIESIGLLKFDFLGLRTLTVLRDAAEAIRQNHGIEVDYNSLDLSEPAVYAMIARGETEGVFQLESRGMVNFMKDLKPESLEDLIAGISLFRPGPMDQIPRYVAARHNQDLIKYDHPLLQPILQVTYGCIVYQEQVMRIVRDLAGFSMGMSDIVRRAMAKKKPKELATYENLFLFGGTDINGNQVDGCIQRGVEEAIGRKIFNDVLAFAGYAFNKPHAAAYAVVGYYTAWLKYHYPVELMAATLNSYLGNLHQASAYVQVCHKYGIEVLPLDINKSSLRFTTEGRAIRFALGAVKNVGTTSLKELIAEREQNGEFKDPGDFWQRINTGIMNRKMHESLIRAGALDCFGISRAQLLSALIPYLDLMANNKVVALSGQQTLFELSPQQHEVIAKPVYQDVPPFSQRERLKMEQELLGLYLTGHPLDDYRLTVAQYRDYNSSALRPIIANEGEETVILSSAQQSETDFAKFNADFAPEDVMDIAKDGEKINLIAYLVERNDRLTRNNQKMSVLACEDFGGRFEVVIFPRDFMRLNSKITVNEVYEFEGRVNRKDDTDPANLILENLRQIRPDNEQPKHFANPNFSNYLAAQTTALGSTELGAKANDYPRPHSSEGEHQSWSSQVDASASISTSQPAQYYLIFTYPHTRPKQDLNKLLKMLQANPGNQAIAIHVLRTGRLEFLDSTYNTDLTEEFLQELNEFWGIDNFRLELL